MIATIDQSYSEEPAWMERKNALAQALPGGKSAQAVVGIRLDRAESYSVGQLRESSSAGGSSTSRSLNCFAGNAPAWAGQAENPPKPVWAFGWLISIADVTEQAQKQPLCQWHTFAE